MSSWKLAPCLKVFNDELEAIAPNRDHASDGTIGDEAHQGTDSDHNPDDNGIVCATDRDKDLRASFTMEDVVQYLLAECRKPNDVGKDRGRLNYLIYNKRIWRADTGWKQEPYTGSSPHTEHLHGSCEHDLNYVNDTRTWGLIERFGGETVDSAQEDRIAKKAADQVWSRMFTRPDGPDAAGNTQTSAAGYQMYNDVVTNNAAQKVIDTLGPQIAEIKALFDAHAAGILEEEDKTGKP